MFEIDKTYTKNDIYELLSVPSKKRKGAWDTGYREYDNNIYIFANVGVPGRTGSDYNNFWDGDLFHWEAKTNSNINQPLIRKMTANSPDYNIYLFTRTNNFLPFTYEGNMIAKEYSETIPVKIIWSFRNPYNLNNELTNTKAFEPFELYEGKRNEIILNKFERNPLARRICIKQYGYSCQICSFNFYSTYGEIGKDFLHVHHIVPISEIGKNYKIDPIKDLIPVCPNCHAMIHRHKERLSIEDIKESIHNV